jgi:hypothetical protein
MFSWLDVNATLIGFSFYLIGIHYALKPIMIYLADKDDKSVLRNITFKFNNILYIYLIFVFLMYIIYVIYKQYEFIRIAMVGVLYLSYFFYTLFNFIYVIYLFKDSKENTIAILRKGMLLPMLLLSLLEVWSFVSLIIMINSLFFDINNLQNWSSIWRIFILTGITVLQLKNEKEGE